MSEGVVGAGFVALILSVIGVTIIAAFLTPINATSNVAWNETFTATNESLGANTSSPAYWKPIANPPMLSLSKCYGVQSSTYTVAASRVNASYVNITGWISGNGTMTIGCDYSYTRHVPGSSSEAVFWLVPVVLIAAGLVMVMGLLGLREG